MSSTTTETFFLPDEIDRDLWTIPADIYNLCHTLLARSELSCVFVPVRSLQVLSIITDTEIVFVDSHAYAYDQEQGGRLITLVWKLSSHSERKSLDDPMPCEIIYYHEDSKDMQLRVVREFRDALKLLDKRYRDQAMQTSGARILKLK